DIGYSCVKIRGPCLVGGTCETNEENGAPFTELRDEKYRDYTKRKDKHTGFTGACDCPPLLVEVTDHPSAEDTEDGDDRVNGNKVYPAFFDIESSCFFEIIRQPYQKEPPNRVGHKFRDDKRPGLTIAQQSEPGYLL